MRLTHLFDTAVLIDHERAAESLPEHSTWAISAMTIAELGHGVLAARASPVLARRLSTFEAATKCVILPLDSSTARTLGELLAWGESEGARPSLADAIIAATAATHGLVLVSLDRGLEPLRGFDGLDLLLLE